jgi:hypothetical protein
VRNPNWNYNITIIRPILLIDCTRKWMRKILTYRLQNVIQVHDILKGSNFAALKGTITNEPIAIINNLIEDANDHRSEL